MIRLYKCYGIMDEDGNCPENLTLEVWGKNPDWPEYKFYFSDYDKIAELPLTEEEERLFTDEHSVFQWVLWCASKVTSPILAKEMTLYALENCITWE